ncbi:MAG: pyruvate kinase [Chthonomonadaceae bacterium]|nr:pyruvate kinase [Chthonomonadaceae bacterium]
MNANGTPSRCASWDRRALQTIAERLLQIREEISRTEARHRDCLTSVHPTHRQSACNLLHYLAFRRYDLRPLQEDLASIGLSSLGRNEASVAFSIDALLRILNGLIGSPLPASASEIPPPTCAQGRALLEQNTCRLLGPPPPGRKVRIMVTMPAEAATDPDFVRELIVSGMDCMRINCAHDHPDAWHQMATHLRRAQQETGRTCRLLMDLAGPKLRTGHVRQEEPELGVLRLFKGDLLRLTRDPLPGQVARRDPEGRIIHPAQIACQLPEVFPCVRPGERIWFDDGKIGGIVRDVRPDALLIEITHARDSGEKLRAEKGINLPDSALNLPALTEQDLQNLPFIAAHADMIGYSFVQRASDVDELRQRLSELSATPPAIVIKVETQRAFLALPQLLLAGLRAESVGIMIARGDLAVELGYERMAEVQEEILWVCEAAHVPVIWATQVLEGLAQKGRPSRAEITDAAMGVRAECVMLNKGPHVIKAVRTLDDILRRMQEHQLKKRSLLRELHAWAQWLEGESGNTGEPPQKAPADHG